MFKVMWFQIPYGILVPQCQVYIQEGSQVLEVVTGSNQRMSYYNRLTSDSEILDNVPSLATAG